MYVPAPNKAVTDPDHSIACQEAMAVWFNGLADLSEIAGWDGDVVAAAHVKLADANVKSRQANRETDAAIANIGKLRLH